MTQFILGVAIFIIVFVLKLLLGAAGGALQAVESVSRNNDFERFTKNNSSSNSNLLVNKSSGAQKIREYQDLYDDGIISYEEFEQVKRNVLNGVAV